MHGSGCGGEAATEAGAGPGGGGGGRPRSRWERPAAQSLRLPVPACCRHCGCASRRSPSAQQATPRRVPPRPKCRRYNLPSTCGLPPGIDDCLVGRHREQGPVPAHTPPFFSDRISSGCLRSPHRWGCGQASLQPRRLLPSAGSGPSPPTHTQTHTPPPAFLQVHFFCFYCASHQVGHTPGKLPHCSEQACGSCRARGAVGSDSAARAF